MAVRIFVAQNQDENQILKFDHPSRYIVNEGSEWQFLFNANSTIDNSAQTLKTWAQLDTNTLDKIRLVGYLYNNANGTIDNAASCQFKIYNVKDITTPKWDDQLLTTVNGVLQSNNYYFTDVLISSLIGTNLDGDTTLMIETTMVRSGTTFRDRVYVNHLGVYDSIVRLRADVEFLDLTKLDE